MGCNRIEKYTAKSWVRVKLSFTLFQLLSLLNATKLQPYSFNLQYISDYFPSMITRYIISNKFRIISTEKTRFGPIMGRCDSTFNVFGSKSNISLPLKIRIKDLNLDPKLLFFCFNFKSIQPGYAFQLN